MSAPAATTASPPATSPTTTSAPALPKPQPPTTLTKSSNQAYLSDSDSDGQARGGRRSNNKQFVVPLPTSTGLSQPAGQLLRGATDDAGNQKAAALLIGIKLDLEAEVHLTARVKGDICVGLY